MTDRLLSLRGGMFEVEVAEQGSGPRLLYLHGIWDAYDTSFINALSRGFTVVSPRFPGFGRSTGDEHLHDVHDAIYYLLDVLDALDARDVPLVGHCLGGMFAAELAAVQPRRFTRLALLAPFGLWDGAQPGLDFFAAGRPELEAALYGPAAPAPPDELAWAADPVAAAIRRAKALEVAARFLWPLPNRGLAKRIHRVGVPCLLLWGANDGIVPPGYGERLRALVPGSELRLIPEAAHLPHLRQPDLVVEHLRHFLRGG